MRLPLAGTVTDDYGIARVWFECAIDQRNPSATAAIAPRGRPTELSLDGVAMEAGELKLKPGQKLLVCLKAADFCDLRPQPNVGVGERWLLDVVTPEQLRAILEARELVQRQRLEAIIEDVAETRDLLLRMEFQRREGKRMKAADEPGEEAAAEKLSPERQLELRTLRAQQALQNSRKSGQETGGVAEAIDDICRQLTNNRIDTEELKLRLVQGVAEPLHKVAGQMFPELERRLEALEAAVADSRLGPQRRQAAQEQVDQIILAMRKALGRMIEMEDFNELVALLRAIITAQDASPRRPSSGINNGSGNCWRNSDENSPRESSKVDNDRLRFRDFRDLRRLRAAPNRKRRPSRARRKNSHPTATGRRSL